MTSAFKRVQVLFEREGCRRAMDPIGVGGLVRPSTASHRRNTRKQDRRGLVNAWHGRLKRVRGPVGMIDEFCCAVHVAPYWLTAISGGSSFPLVDEVGRTNVVVRFERLVNPWIGFQEIEETFVPLKYILPSYPSNGKMVTSTRLTIGYFMESQTGYSQSHSQLG